MAVRCQKSNLKIFNNFEKKTFFPKKKLKTALTALKKYMKALKKIFF